MNWDRKRRGRNVEILNEFDKCKIYHINFSSPLIEIMKLNIVPSYAKFFNVPYRTVPFKIKFNSFSAQT